MNFIVSFDVKPECAEEFQSVMLDTQISLPNVEGCHSVSIYREEGSTLRYTLVEAWKSKEDHQAHVSSMVQSGTWDSILKMLSQPPVGAYCTVL